MGDQSLIGDSFKLRLSHQNHFKFGYNGNWFVERQSPEDEWCVAYGRSSRSVKDWRNECVETARLIRDDTDRPLWALFSGGIDSEVVLQSFLFAGIPVKAAITRFKNDLNRQDTFYAIKFCETHGIPYKCLDIDIRRFFESGDAMSYAERTKCVQPQLLHTMWAMDQIDGYPILGSGECFLVKQTPKGYKHGVDPYGDDDWVMYEKERIAGWYRHLMVRGREGCAGFFQYNPENMLAFLLDSTMVDLCSNRLTDYVDTMPVKGSIYRKYFLLEKRKKYHGFENVMDLDDWLRPQLQEKFGAYDRVVKTEYKTLVEGLSQ